MNQYFIKLATKIIDYSRKYEFYEYTDSGETEEEQIIKLAQNFERNKMNIQDMIEIYREILGTESNEDALSEANEILQELKKLQKKDKHIFKE